MYDAVIVGGGIVGLATAYRLKEKQPDWKIALLEKENRLTAHQTGNNSGVIHSGIYYKPGSLKAINCRDGYSMLLDFCQKENIPYELCGKIIVATHQDEVPRLENLYERGIQNGLSGLKKISADQIKDYEPYSTGLAAILVPQTGIVDYKVVSQKIAYLFVHRMGGEIHLQQKVDAIQHRSGSTQVITTSHTFETKRMVNTAGLYSDKIAKLAGTKTNVRIIPFRGEYFEVKKEKHFMVKNLIYPVPDPAFPFLGVHFTRRIDGGIEAGPNAIFAFKREGYKKSDISFAETFQSLTWPGFIKIMLKYGSIGIGEFYRSYNKQAFTRALQRLLPSITKDDLNTGGSGVRAQACTRAGQLIDDFIIVEDRNCIHVLNAPSPAATSSLAIGKTIAERVLKNI